VGWIRATRLWLNIKAHNGVWKLKSAFEVRRFMRCSEVWFCCSVISVWCFVRFSNSICMKTVYFPLFTCCGFCFDLIILVLSLLAFSFLALGLHHLPASKCLQISDLRKRRVTWNRIPIKSNVLTHNSCCWGPLWKQTTYTLQFLSGSPSIKFESRAFTHFNGCWGPLWKQITFKLQLLFGAPLKAQYLHITVSVKGPLNAE